MLVKFFRNKGHGSAKASLDYLLGKDRDRLGATLLSGNPELSQAIADGLEFKNRYTVGCLSFEESNIDKATKQAIMDSFERTVFAGLNREQYNITWVEHTDKGRLELNFFTPNVELDSGKRYQPYYDKADRGLINDWKAVINHECNLSDPHAPEKARTQKHSFTMPKDVKGLKNAITEHLELLASEKLIEDRTDVKNAITDLGLEIVRETPKSLSIKNPDGQRNIRLSGAIYEQDYRTSRTNTETIQERAREYQAGSQQRYERAYSRLKQRIRDKQSYNAKKYFRAERSLGDDRLLIHGNNLPSPNNSLSSERIKGLERNQSNIEPVREISGIERLKNIAKHGRDDYSNTNIAERPRMENKRISRYQDKLKKLYEDCYGLYERTRKYLQGIRARLSGTDSREQRAERAERAITESLRANLRANGIIGENQRKIEHNQQRIEHNQQRIAQMEQRARTDQQRIAQVIQSSKQVLKNKTHTQDRSHGMSL